MKLFSIALIALLLVSACITSQPSGSGEDLGVEESPFEELPEYSEEESLIGGDLDIGTIV